ncbi:MAG: hypothetical protein PGN34_12980 [Methylobacterium frigidaeris]
MGASPLRHYRARMPEADASEDLPLVSYYEVDHDGDAVTRAVEIYPDGRITRDSIAIEQRNGDHCPSLIDMALAGFIAAAPLEEIERETFEARWAEGADTPFWFPRR